MYQISVLYESRIKVHVVAGWDMSMCIKLTFLDLLVHQPIILLFINSLYPLFVYPTSQQPMETSNTHDKDIVKVHRADYLLWCATHSNLLGSPLSPLHHLTSRQSSSAMVLQLPPELLLEIFSYLMDSQTTLYSISLVCKSWLACVLPLLYRHPRIMDTYRWATFIVTLTRTKRMLDYGAHVQSVCLFTPKERSKSLYTH